MEAFIFASWHPSYILPFTLASSQWESDFKRLLLDLLKENKENNWSNGVDLAVYELHCDWAIPSYVSLITEDDSVGEGEQAQTAPF